MSILSIAGAIAQEWFVMLKWFIYEPSHTVHTSIIHFPLLLCQAETITTFPVPDTALIACVPYEITQYNQNSNMYYSMEWLAY